MNAEKELLLSLLVEKYSEKKTIVRTPKATPKRSRKFKKPHHKWTQFQKEKLVYLKNDGRSWPEIAALLGHGISSKQCHSMYHNVLVADRKANRG